MQKKKSIRCVFVAAAGIILLLNAIWQIKKSSDVTKTEDPRDFYSGIDMTHRGDNSSSIAAVKKQDRFVMGCAEIAKLEVVRVLGRGKHKIAFEVELPWGEHGVAKRCIKYRCIRDGKPRKEAR